MSLSKICFRLRPAPSKCLSDMMNWIISRIPHRISKIPMNEKLERAHFFKVRSDRITVWYWSATISQVCQIQSGGFFEMFVAFSEYKNFLLKPALASELVKTILFNQRVVWKTFDSISFCALVLVNYPNFSIIF